MNSPCAPSSWRRLRSSFIWMMVTLFPGSIPPALFAQTNDTAVVVRGRVTDTSGAALTGASVTPGNLATGLERVVITDAKGNLAFVAPGGGRYRLFGAVDNPPTAAIRIWAHHCRSFALNWGARSASECASRGHRSAGKARRAAWKLSRLAPSAGRNEACEENPASPPPVN
jgi:hypothetical protein